MALWLVRAGKYGEREPLALEKERAIIGWEWLPDLSAIDSREALQALIADRDPDVTQGRLVNWTAQLWSFIKRIEIGDLIVLPSKHRGVVIIGRVDSGYEYATDLVAGEGLHTRRVKWLEEYPRDRFDQDLLYSFGAFMTICQIQRNDAEGRVRDMLAGKARSTFATSSSVPVEGDEANFPSDLETYARDQIRAFIARRFKGHELTRLVAAVLQVQGYQTHVAPEGPDGGIDIVAAPGGLGFGEPRLAVQVKSGDDTAGTSVVNELRGAMKTVNATRGLVVSWSGFRRPVDSRRAELFFDIRLWDADDLIAAVTEVYERLPDDMQSKLPLKRAWVLVQEDLSD